MVALGLLAAVIAKRAGVSGGALFRHFPTMSDFMAATAQEVARRQLDLAAKLVAQIPAGQPPLPAMLTILRDIAGSDTNTVWHELMVAARTDDTLRATLRTVLAAYAENIFRTARTAPGLERVPDEELAVALTTVLNIFDGAALVRRVLPQPELEDARIALLTDLLGR